MLPMQVAMSQSSSTTSEETIIFRERRQKDKQTSRLSWIGSLTFKIKPTLFSLLQHLHTPALKTRLPQLLRRFKVKPKRTPSFFLDLPVEIRQKIYYQHFLALWTPTECDAASYQSSSPYGSKSVCAIFLLNRRTSAEVSYVFWTSFGIFVPCTSTVGSTRAFFECVGSTNAGLVRRVTVGIKLRLEADGDGDGEGGEGDVERYLAICQMLKLGMKSLRDVTVLLDVLDEAGGDWERMARDVRSVCVMFTGVGMIRVVEGEGRNCRRSVLERWVRWVNNGIIEHRDKATEKWEENDDVVH